MAHYNSGNWLLTMNDSNNHLANILASIENSIRERENWILGTSQTFIDENEYDGMKLYTVVGTLEYNDILEDFRTRLEDLTTDSTYARFVNSDCSKVYSFTSNTGIYELIFDSGTTVLGTDWLDLSNHIFTSYNVLLQIQQVLNKLIYVAWEISPTSTVNISNAEFKENNYTTGGEPGVSEEDDWDIARGAASATGKGTLHSVEIYNTSDKLYKFGLFRLGTGTYPSAFYSPAATYVKEDDIPIRVDRVKGTSVKTNVRRKSIIHVYGYDEDFVNDPPGPGLDIVRPEIISVEFESESGNIFTLDYSDDLLNNVLYINSTDLTLTSFPTLDGSNKTIEITTWTGDYTDILNQRITAPGSDSEPFHWWVYVDFNMDFTTLVGTYTLSNISSELTYG